MPHRRLRIDARAVLEPAAPAGQGVVYGQDQASRPRRSRPCPRAAAFARQSDGCRRPHQEQRLARVVHLARRDSSGSSWAEGEHIMVQKADPPPLARRRTSGAARTRRKIQRADLTMGDIAEAKGQMQACLAGVGDVIHIAGLRRSHADVGGVMGQGFCDAHAVAPLSTSGGLALILQPRPQQHVWRRLHPIAGRGAHVAERRGSRGSMACMARATIVASVQGCPRSMRPRHVRPVWACRPCRQRRAGTSVTISSMTSIQKHPQTAEMS